MYCTHGKISIKLTACKSSDDSCQSTALKITFRNFIAIIRRQSELLIVSIKARRVLMQSMEANARANSSLVRQHRFNSATCDLIFPIKPTSGSSTLLSSSVDVLLSSVGILLSSVDVLLSSVGVLLSSVGVLLSSCVELFASWKLTAVSLIFFFKGFNWVTQGARMFMFSLATCWTISNDKFALCCLKCRSEFDI